MDEKWAKELVEKIAAGSKKQELDTSSARIVKFAESARSKAAHLLFGLFIDKIDAVCRHLEQAEGKTGLFRRFRKSGPPVLNYTVIEGLTFRFQLREASGQRLEIDYDRGAEPRLTVDVATAELIQGEYLPIFRESGAVAGAQIWRQRRVDGKHPDLIARLLLLLSATALDESLKIEDAVSWVYEDDERPFTARSVEELIENLIAAA